MTGPNDENFGYYIDGTGPDGAIQVDLDDLESEVLQTLGQYLSEQTVEGHPNGPGPSRPNRFVVKGNQVEYFYTDSSGNPVPFVTTGDADEVFHADDLDPFLEEYSDSQKIFTPTIGDYFSKGQDGDDLLKGVNELPGLGLDRFGSNQQIIGEVPEDSPSGKIVNAVSAVLLNNRFTPEGTFDPTGDRTPSDPLAGRQDMFGSYTSDLAPVTLGQLQEIGEDLLLAAVARGDGFDPARAVSKVPVSDLISENMPTKPSLDSSEVFSRGGESYGSFNTFNQMFSLNLGAMRELAISLLSVLKDELIELASQVQMDFQTSTDTVLASTPSTVQGETGDQGVFDNFASYIEAKHDTLFPTADSILAGFGVGPGAEKKSLDDYKEASLIAERIIQQYNDLYSLGEFSRPTFFTPSETQITGIMPPYEDVHNRKSFLGITRTDFPFDQAFDAGFNAMFGTQENPSSTLTRSPGFFANLARTIYRSIVELQFDQGEDPLEQLRGNKALGMVNIIAKIGDISLRMETIEDESPAFLTTVRNSVIDLLPSLPRTNAMMSRTQTPRGNQLAWRTSSTPGCFLLPTGIILADFLLASKHADGTMTIQESIATSTVLDKFTGVNPIAEAINSPATSPANDLLVGRLPSLAVEMIENQLEAEYVPFYFHDIRTNEIVSFHAFLSTLSDSYTPVYTDVPAYGRIDDVKIYKSTKRSINLDFIIASTNKFDFDEMWWKINKLVTLVYPQWDRGTLIVNLGVPPLFIQPFSQSPKAAPLIRLRIGDLVKSNFSRFALGRLFGLGEYILDPISAQMVAGLGGFGNAVARSFRASAGRGLAGFITNLSFEWLSDTITWETEAYGSRAPKMCKVTIGFDPIHDIAPGIDHAGFNRAPLYNVGQVVNSISGENHASGFESPQGRANFESQKRAVDEHLDLHNIKRFPSVKGSS